MTRLLLWRHGRTDWNQSRRIQGQSDTELDETGLREAERSAPLVAACRPDLIISSDLRRCTVTAGVLAGLTGLPVELDPRLRERHFGSWQGMLSADVPAAHRIDYMRLGTAVDLDNPDIETLDEMADRVGPALLDAAKQGAGGTVVVVTHGVAARVGTGVLLGWPVDMWHTLAPLGNCCATDLRLSPDRGWQLHRHNIFDAREL
jgi:glucosyl-3-phosphoglycerate phosphatase